MSKHNKHTKSHKNGQYVTKYQGKFHKLGFHEEVKKYALIEEVIVMANRVRLNKSQFGRHAYKPSVTNTAGFKRVKARTKKEIESYAIVQNGKFIGMEDFSRKLTKLLKIRNDQMVHEMEDEFGYKDDRGRII